MRRSLSLLACILLLVSVAGSSSAVLASAPRPSTDDAKADKGGTEEVYYAIEMNGVVCGYARFDIGAINAGGKDLTLLKEYVFIMLSALGANFNSEVSLTYHIDPETGQFVYHDSKVDQSDIHLESRITVQGDTARFTSSESGVEDLCYLPEGTIRENTLFFPFLKKDFIDGTAESKKYPVYEVRENEIQETQYTKAGTEELELAGRKYETVIIDELNLDTGVKVRWWLDSSTGRMLKARILDNRLIYLADESVIKKIEMADLDKSILVKANVRILDVTSISYMKVKAKLEPVGVWVTMEGLNVPGQKFEGTVEENLIEGVFEIEHQKYSGENAPAFPPAFGDDPELEKYIKPADFIESDDPVLVAKARKLTEGSADSWEAAVRLSKWVADNISYAIPGGGTARKTYDIRAGECGAHSMLLAAFCRSVGIPARVVWGCMYTMNLGGSFGQHAWDEIYMGDAGWVPVDATAFEADFLDSGHIRIGEMQSPTIALNAKSFEILEHRLGAAGDAGPDSAAADAKYAEYVGDYKGPQGTVFKVLVQDGALGVDIPNQIVLLLKDPDEQGRRYAKLTGRVFVTFDRGEDGKVGAMLLHEMVQLPRRADPDSIPEGLAKEIVPYLGKYFLAQAQAELTVFCREDGGLAIDDPINKAIVGLDPLNEPGRYIDDRGKNIISFVKDDSGKVSMLMLEVINRFER